jgi:hypothetical protein
METPLILHEHDDEKLCYKIHVINTTAFFRTLSPNFNLKVYLSFFKLIQNFLRFFLFFQNFNIIVISRFQWLISAEGQIT